MSINEEVAFVFGVGIITLFWLSVTSQLYGSGQGKQMFHCFEEF